MPRENMTEAMARELLRVAQHYGGWTPDDPDRTPENTDLDLAFQEANQLYDVVLDSYKSGVRSPAILDMLFAGMVEPVADHPEVYDGNRESIFESERRALSDLEPVAPAPPQEKPAQGTAHENTNLGSAFDPVTQSISGDASQPAALPHPLETHLPGIRRLRLQPDHRRGVQGEGFRRAPARRVGRHQGLRARSPEPCGDPGVRAVAGARRRHRRGRLDAGTAARHLRAGAGAAATRHDSGHAGLLRDRGQRRVDRPDPA
jgi:hypothetical protein